MKELPEGLIVSRAVSYNVKNIVEQIMEIDPDRTEKPDLEEIIDYIADWWSEDLTHANFSVRIEDQDGEWIGDYA